MKKIVTIFLFILLALSMTACTNSWVCEATGGRVACPTAETPTTPEEPVNPTQPEQPSNPAEPENPMDETVVEETCVTTDWFNKQVESTNTVSELLSEVDRQFNLNQKIGGAWTQEMAESANGFTVPANSTFWTDLFENVSELPEGVSVVRTQGGWGIYRTSVAYRIPLPNGGGRYANLCGVASELPNTACLSEEDLNNITGSQEPVEKFNDYFESAGFAYGDSVEEGDEVPAGVIFLGTFPESSIPAGVINLADGFIWEVSQPVTAPNGGRYITACR